VGVRRRNTRQWYVSGVLVVTAVIAALVLVVTLHSERGTIFQHTTGTLLTALDVIGIRVIMVPVIGTREAGHFAVLGGSALLTAAALGGIVLAGVAFYYATFESRLFLVYGVLAAAAALVAEHSIWNLLLGTGGAQYWFVPMLSWMCALVILSLQAKPALLRGLACLLCLLFLIYGVPHDWRFPPMPNEHYSHYVELFNRAKPGQRVHFFEDPPGWGFVLIKR
jgi:hypothetical protein